MEYPEHEKLKAVQPQSQAIHQFILEFLQPKGIFLAEHLKDEDGDNLDTVVPVYTNTTKLVAEFLEIDERALENEKLAMLDELRKANEKRV